MFRGLKKFVWHVGWGVRETGQALDRVGSRLQGEYAFKERLCRHRRIMPLYGVQRPSVGDGTFVAPNAAVIGHVEVGENSSIWYGAVLRGDVNTIKVGSYTSIGDRVVIHVSLNNPGGPSPAIVGDRVIVGQGAVLHACTLHDECSVGMGAVVFDGAVIEKHAILEPGSVLTAGKVVPSGQVWSGNPAKYTRDATAEEIQAIGVTAAKYSELAQKHIIETTKTDIDIQIERDERENMDHASKAIDDKDKDPVHGRL